MLNTEQFLREFSDVDYHSPLDDIFILTKEILRKLTTYIFLFQAYIFMYELLLLAYKIQCLITLRSHLCACFETLKRRRMCIFEDKNSRENGKII